MTYLSPKHRMVNEILDQMVFRGITRHENTATLALTYLSQVYQQPVDSCVLDLGDATLEAFAHKCLAVYTLFEQYPKQVLFSVHDYRLKTFLEFLQAEEKLVLPGMRLNLHILKQWLEDGHYNSLNNFGGRLL